MELSDQVIYFLKKQGVVLVSSLDAAGNIHASVKGIVGVEKEGRIFIIDLYMNRTFRNLKQNPVVTISAVDERSFQGFALQGEAKIVARADIADHIIEAWEQRIVERISRRVIRRVQSGGGVREDHGKCEAGLPRHPQYLIEVDVFSVIDLSPPVVQQQGE